MHAIEVEGVSKAFRVFSERNQSMKQALIRRRRARYEEFWALRDVSFNIEAGTTFGMIGSNGAGKSTALKLLAQILVPDRGRIHVEGRVSALLELGAGFHADLSGRENVFLNGAILGLSRRTLKDRLDAIVEFADLGAFIDNPVKTYSSGMYARLGFAVAVNVDPEVLLIDEVLAVGDENFQRKCAERIAELRSGGRTVVLVSHSLGSIQAMCDRAAWIDHGNLRAIGPASEVVDAYIGTVHPTAVVDASGRVRTGSGETRAEVTVVDARTEAATTVPRSGSPVRLDFELTTVTACDEAVVVFGIRRADGIEVAGTTSRQSFPTLALPTGVTRFSYAVPALALLPGSYDVFIRVTDWHHNHLIDGCEHALRIDVQPIGDGAIHTRLVDLSGI